MNFSDAYFGLITIKYAQRLNIGIQTSPACHHGIYCFTIKYLAFRVSFEACDLLVIRKETSLLLFISLPKNIIFNEENVFLLTEWMKELFSKHPCFIKQDIWIFLLTECIDRASFRYRFAYSLFSSTRDLFCNDSIFGRPHVFGLLIIFDGNITNLYP